MTRLEIGIGALLWSGAVFLAGWIAHVQAHLWGWA